MINRQISQNQQYQEQGEPRNALLKSKIIIGDNQIKEDLVCFICSCLLLDTSVCSTCGKTYCSNCIEAWLKEGIGCLNCESKEFKRKKPPMYDDFMKLLKFDCPYTLNSDEFAPCTNKGMTLAEVQNHIQLCNFAVKKCENNECSYEGNIPQLNEHRIQCGYRLFQCIHCNQQMQNRHQIEHDQKCPKKQIHCANCKAFIYQLEMEYHCQNECLETQMKCNFCNEISPRKIYNLHQSICPQRPMRCSCNKTFPYQQFQEHQQQCSQIQLTCEKCNKKYMRKEIHTNSDCIKYLSTKCQLIETDVFLLNEQIREIRQHLRLPVQQEEIQYKSLLRHNHPFYQ